MSSLHLFLLLQFRMTEEYKQSVEHIEQKKTTFFESVNARYNQVDPQSYLRQDDEGSLKFWFRRLGQIKPVELLWGEAEGTQLRRALNTFQLTAVGIGAIIGTGIFVLSGQAAANNAGPAVTISFVVAAVASGKGDGLLVDYKSNSDR